MSGIRAAHAEDMANVASLYERVVRSGSSQPPPRLAEYFFRMFFGNPWTPADCPSLVFEDGEGGIAGFGGVQVRPLMFNGRPLRMIVSGPLFVDPQSKAKGAGIVLLKAIQQLPGDVWLTDGATPTMQRICERMGGQTHSLYCMSWLRPFQPMRRLLLELSQRPRLKPYERLAYLGWPICAAADRLLHGVVTRHFAKKTPVKTGRRSNDAPLNAERRSKDAPLTAEPLSAECWFELRKALSKEVRLHVEYTVQSLDWQIKELAEITAHGELRSALLRDRSSRPVGAFLYYLKRRGIARVVHVCSTAAARRAVLEHLMRDADDAGALALEGRVEPQDLRELADLGCKFRYGGPRAVIQAKDPAIYAALFSAQALLTRMDGESWTGFSFEPFD